MAGRASGQTVGVRRGPEKFCYAVALAPWGGLSAPLERSQSPTCVTYLTKFGRCGSKRIGVVRRYSIGRGSQKFRDAGPRCLGTRAWFSPCKHAPPHMYTAMPNLVVLGQTACGDLPGKLSPFQGHIWSSEPTRSIATCDFLYRSIVTMGHVVYRFRDSWRFRSKSGRLF